MLYALHKGNVEGHAGGQSPVIYLASTVQEVIAAGVRFCFTDGHAIMAITNFFTDPTDLKKLDWDTIKSQFWFDSLQYPDRKRKRQAEFLVHRFFPLALVREIGVRNATAKTKVEAILNNHRHGRNLIVRVRSAWYY